MFLFLVKKYWVEFAIIVCIIFVLGYIKHLKNDINDGLNTIEKLQSKVNEKQAYITAQNIAIESNRADYKAGLERLPTVLKSIDTKYKTEVVTIEKWRETNASDCNASLAYINSYKF